MSILSDEQARRAMPVHMRTNGSKVTRIVGGVKTPNIDGIWVEYSEDQLSSQRPVRDTSEGLRVTRHGLLLLNEGSPVTENDQWLIKDELWQTQRVGAEIGGYREMYLQRDDQEHTTRAARHRTV